MKDLDSYEVSRCLFRESCDAIIILRATQADVLEVNPSVLKLTGRRRKDLLGSPLPDVLTSAEDPQLLELLRACQESGLIHAREGYALVGDAGQPIPVCVSITRMHTQPEPTALLLMRDRSDEKAAELERTRLVRQVRQADHIRSLGLLAGGLAHDFNNLLGGIVGNADLALASVDPASPAATYLQDVLASVEHARALVERMVSITGKGKMHLREVDLGGMVQGVFRIWKASAPQHLQSDVRTTDPPVMVRADPTQLSRVIWNLLQNASDALAGPLGKIEVTVSVEAIDPSVTQFRGQELVGGDYGVLSIADDGAGMSPSDREQMCDPFFTTKEEGRGLGLSAVLGIVQGHHGALQVESEVGRGTRMRVFLPLAPQDGANAEGSLVLVVDDEEPIRRVARKALSKHGYRVCLAGSGGEGLRVFESRRDEICVVLLDMTMPDLQGAEVLRRIRESGSQVPVLLCSGFDRQAFQSSECEDPRVAFIEKPYGARNLIDRIEHLLAAAP